MRKPEGEAVSGVCGTVAMEKLYTPVEIVYAIRTSSIEFVLQEGSEYVAQTMSGPGSSYLAIPVRLRRKTMMSTVVRMTSETTMSANAIENSH